ncbi:MAG: hypothetical protein MJZ97_06840 [Bacteroidales bacterium]|nr:hypothetical protein [Bacteroidales bacterium]
MKLRWSDAKKNGSDINFSQIACYCALIAKMSLGAVQAAKNIKTPTPFFVFCGQSYSRQGYLNLIQAFVLTFNTGNDVVVVNILIRWKKSYRND